MENASEALMMAFGVLIFVLALTVAINSFSQVKSVSDVVIYTKDETNYYEYEGATGKASQNRIVGIETIIPNLYKYSKENYTVLFRQANYDSTTGEFTNIQPLTIYTTKAQVWRINDLKETDAENEAKKNYKKNLKDKYENYLPDTNFDLLDLDELNLIFSFDTEEETQRNEPWLSSEEQIQENLRCFINGKTYTNPNNGNDYIKYKDTGLGGLIQNYSDSSFVETIGEYSYYIEEISEDEYILQYNKGNKKKRIIIYTLINNQ